ncbi:MAG TPA: DnaB-like helicase C-terminal domain-containing protein [Burkholderiaceae bacterium]
MHEQEIAGILEADDIDFDKYLKETDTAEKVRPVIDYLDQVMHELSPAFAEARGPRLPFANAWVNFAPGEVTLWGGYNSSGKSLLTGQIVTGFAQAGESVCIASLEMRPRKTLARIGKQAFGTTTPTKEQVKGFLQGMQGKMWIFDHVGSIKPERLVAVVKYCADALKIKHFVIDNLTACIESDDDFNAQKRIMLAICAAARDLDIHIHVVVHFRKDKNEEGRPSRMDIKGTGAITDLVDQVLLVWRNRRKERLAKAGDDSAAGEADTLLICDKNRNGEWEGDIQLWYEPHILRFTDKPDTRRGLARSLSPAKGKQ